MKLALVTMRTDPARGGAERYTVDLADALARAGHEVALLASSFGGVPAGVRSVPIEARGLTRVSRYRRFLDALDRHLLGTHYDIVHAMLPVRRCDVYHPHAGLARANVRHDSAMTRLLNPRRGYVARVEGELLESATPPAVLCLSEYVRSQVQSVYRLADDRLPILFNAVDLEKFDPRRRPEARQSARERYGFAPNDAVALFLGHDFERKGLRGAIEAMAQLRTSREPHASRIKLLVVGRAHAEKYRALAASLGVADRVSFSGYSDDAYGVYRASDFLVLPTKHDPCSLVVLEGLAMGVPVISTRFNGACEIMASGTHGYVLDDPAGIGALAHAMSSLSDPATRARMAEACLALRPRLAYDRHLATLLSIYDRVKRSRA